MGKIEDVLSGASQWCIIHASNLDVLKSMPADSVQHVITDPPYSEFVHKNIKKGSGGKSIKTDVPCSFKPITQDQIESVSDEFARLATRWAMAFSDVESCHLWRGAMTSTGSLVYCRTGAWDKECSAPQFTGDRPAVGFETITICHRKGKKRWNGGGSRGIWRHRVCSGHSSFENNDRAHPTQKPIDLMLELIQLFTDPGDIILDPYAGDGTTGAAAIRLGRRCIMIEELDTKEQPFASNAKARCAAESRLTTRVAESIGQLSLFG